ncbi:hypothetical protein JST97_37455 [bacterium]|nr:hypothetical protein [bacterium]
MQFLANLQRSTRLLAAGERKEPQNLQELADEVRHFPGAQSAHYCRLWARHLEWHLQDQHAKMSQIRGQSRRLWLEQCLIYQDLVASLEDVAQQMNSGEGLPIEEQLSELEALVEEFAQSAQEMQAWLESNHARCLACGWDGEQPSCPHCQKQLLKPVREARPAHLRVPLADKQAQVFDTVVAVLEGRDDLESLWEPLQDLLNDYCEANQRLNLAADEPEVTVVAQIIGGALDGLDEMVRVFEDSDAQHLEDGWHRFFHSEQCLTAFMRGELADGDAVALDFQEL